MTSKKATRQLISLYQEPDGRYYIHFAYYDSNGRWTGDYEDCRITENELYDLIKPRLNKGR
jgi:hypothetical protein